MLQKLIVIIWADLADCLLPQSYVVCLRNGLVSWVKDICIIMYCFIDRTMSLCKTIILPRSVFVVFFYLLWICHLVTGKLDFIGFVVILIVLNVTFPKSYAPFSSFFFFLSLMTNYWSKTSVSEMLTFGQIPKGEVYSQRQFMFYQHRLCFFCDFLYELYHTILSESESTDCVCCLFILH